MVTNLASIYIMGGAVEVGGNVLANEYAEWNVWIDPAAAQAVFDSDAPIILISLDATNAIPVTQAWYDLLAEGRTAPAANAIFDLFSNSPGVLDGGFFFWDELAAAVLVDRSYVTLEAMSLSVIQGGAEDGRTKSAAGGTEVQVAVAAEAARFQRDLLSILNGEGPVEIQPADPKLVTYFLALEGIVERSDTRINQFFEENEEVGTAFFEPESLPLEQFREGAREFLMTVFSTLEDEFEESQALDVPAEADVLHQAYLASVKAIVSSAPELLAQIDIATADDLGGLFESDFGQALDAFFETCAGLQSLAFAEGIDVELTCSG